MIPLNATNVVFHNINQVQNIILKVTKSTFLPSTIKKNYISIINSSDFIDGFEFYLCFNKKILNNINFKDKKIIVLEDKFSYIDEGDILRISLKEKRVKVLFRNKSKNNSFLVTERCNHYCLMCSQPPKNINDEWIFEEINKVIPLIDKKTEVIGLTGGEPTLQKKKFLKLIKNFSNYLPETKVHILSHGKTFQDIKFTQEFSDSSNQNTVIGIPLYSDISNTHNHIVQCENAFDETIRGIINLKKLGQIVELRFVIHQLNFDRLEKFAEFIVRNLCFVDHVALMGLELMGFARANIEGLFIDPFLYKDDLSAAVNILSLNGVNVSIFNHQLCTLNPEVHEFSVKSISDWKNDFLPNCSKCKKKSECGGFFSSQLLRPSEHIKPFL